MISLIEQALNSRLSTLPGSIPIAWPNYEYTPIINTTYIRPTLLPANGDLLTLDGGYIHTGLYQIDVFCKVGNSTKTLNTLLESIYSLYTENKVLDSNIFVQSVTFEKRNIEDTCFMGSITVQYIGYDY